MEGFFAIVAFFIALLLYFLPWIVAGNRGVSKPAGIILLNVFLGWTLIGWLGALIWAVQAETDGESHAAKAAEEARTARAVQLALEQDRQARGV